MSVPARLGAVAALVLAAAALVPGARADGDPASDYLISQRVFFPFDVAYPASRQTRFARLVEAANKAGFRIRVALIASRYDMGSVTALYRKPRAYAQFLSAELSFAYKHRLLVVMPNGFGFAWPGHRPRTAYAVLDRVPIRPGPLGLLDASQTALERLTRADGITLTAPASGRPGPSGSSSGTFVVAGTLAVLAAAAAAAFFLRRSRRHRAQHR